MNIIIGVGGTGAKVVEAVQHLATMGIGPNTLSVGFVDQDESNGNLIRARTVFDAYRKARASWRDGSTHRIAGTDECPLLKTNLTALGGEGGVWIPDAQPNTTLARVFGPLNEDQFLFDALFDPSDDPELAEQHLDLSQGYRGRPHIGAAAMTLRAETRSRFWDAITEAIGAAGLQGTVRILIAGSVFGGTGAAGFPTIARLIRNRLKDAAIARNVEIGGVLMLPYFGFPDPTEDQDQNVARANEQQAQARGALLHYQHMLGDGGNEEGEHIFDQLTLVGWSPPFKIDVHSKGTGTQRNPALLPELYAASAAMRFFRSGALGSGDGEQTITVSARRDQKAMTWPDIPSVTENVSEQRYLQESVAQFLRFAAAFKYWAPQISDPARRKNLQRDRFYKVQELDQIGWQDDSPAQALDDLSSLLDMALGWCAAIDAYARRDADNRFGLWNVGEPLVERIAFDRIDEDPRIATVLSDDQFRRVYNSIAMKYSDVDEDMPNEAKLADYLTAYALEGQHEKMGRFIAALYNFSGVRPIDEI
jgi:hypothetical protein